MEIKEKINTILTELHSGLINREETIRLAVLTLLTGENLIIIGPPGTAKSEISRRLNELVSDSKYFEYLLTKFTTPEEIFGPLSLSELEKDSFKRKTESYLPDCHIAFLDEIFKANSSILNALLTILNERIYHNGSIKEEVNLFSLIGASNELPREPELEALYDRFLTRIIVEPLSDKRDIINLIQSNNDDFKISSHFSIEEILTIQKESKKVLIPDSIAQILADIRLELDDFSQKELIEIEKRNAELDWDEIEDELLEMVSDRRLKKSLRLLQTSAYTDGRNEISVLDLSILIHCFWNKPENKDKIQNIIKKHLVINVNQEESKVNQIYLTWSEKFNHLFESQKLSDNGQPLYIDKDGKETTQAALQIHKKNGQGHFLYQGKNQITQNMEIIEYHQSFDRHPVLPDYNAVYDYLQCQPIIIRDFENYIRQHPVPINYLNELQNIKQNLDFENNQLKASLDKTSRFKQDVESVFDDHIWINKDEFKSWKEEVIGDFEKGNEIKQKFSKLLYLVDEALISISKDQD